MKYIRGHKKKLVSLSLREMADGMGNLSIAERKEGYEGV